jgi:S-adenosyl methyltransferase
VEVLLSASEQPFPWREAERDLMSGIETAVPVSARIWNYWAGGKDYYPVDEEAGDRFASLYPGIRDIARAARLFIARTVTFLAAEAGVRQFLDIGMGLPSDENTHEIAQHIAANAQVVYVDNDPLVLAHARALLTGILPESTDYIDGDLNYPDKILRIAHGKLDFAQPVAIMLMGVLGHIGNPAVNDDVFVRSVVGRLKDALPPGGYLALYEAADTVPAHNEAIRIYNESGAAPYYLRSPGQIARFFDGLQSVAPGIVPIQNWRPDGRSAALPAEINAWGGVAVKR